MESPYVPIKFRNPHPLPEEVAAVQPFVSFLEDFRKGNLSSMLSHVIPLGRVMNLRPRGMINADMAGLLERLSNLPSNRSVAEPIYDVEVFVDRQIAIAWTPYDFFATLKGEETKMTHRGTDIVFLAKVDGVWKISGIADNCRLVGEDGKIPRRYEGPEHQDPAEEKAIMDIFQKDIIDKMAAWQFDQIRDVLLPDMQLTFHTGTNVEIVSIDDALDFQRHAIGGKEFSEVFHDVKIRIDDDIAMFWGPYKYVVGDDVRWGTEIATYVKIDGVWKVSGLGDNHAAVKGKRQYEE